MQAVPRARRTRRAARRDRPSTRRGVAAQPHDRSGGDRAGVRTVDDRPPRTSWAASGRRRWLHLRRTHAGVAPPPRCLDPAGGHDLRQHLRGLSPNLGRRRDGRPRPHQRRRAPRRRRHPRSHRGCLGGLRRVVDAQLQGRASPAQIERWRPTSRAGSERWAAAGGWGRPSPEIDHFRPSAVTRVVVPRQVTTAARRFELLDLILRDRTAH